MTSACKSRAVCAETISWGLLRHIVRWGLATGARGGWARHPPEGEKPEHYHIVLKWPNAREWSAHRRLANRHDPHSYFAKCGSFRSQMRYLRHLDNSGKTPIPPEDCHAIGEWPPGEWDALMAPDHGVRYVVDYCLSHARDGPMAVVAALLEMGFRPYDIQSALKTVEIVRKFVHDNQSQIPT